MKHEVKSIPAEEILANRCNAYEFIDFNKQETLEEAALKYSAEPQYFGKISGFRAGAKWQMERSYSDMQEYATFCIECDRKEMPLLLVQDWFNKFKNK